MDVQRALLLFCCLLSASMFDRSLVAAQSNSFTKVEGEVFRVSFEFPGAARGSRKYLCRNECEGGDVLIETHGNRAESGRFTVRYDQDLGTLHATVTELRRSDAGRYRVGVSGSSASLGSSKVFSIQVRELCDGGVVSAEPNVYSAAEGAEVTVRCSLTLQPRNRKFLCRDECTKFLFDTNDVSATSGRYRIDFGSELYFNMTIGQLSRSDSGPYRCGVGRQRGGNTCQQFEILVTGGNLLSQAAVCASVVVALLVASLMFVYKRKARRDSVQYVNTVRDTRTPESVTDGDAGFRRESAIYQELDELDTEQNLYWSLEVVPNRHQ